MVLVFPVYYSRPRKFHDKIVVDDYLANGLKVLRDFQGLLYYEHFNEIQWNP